EYRDRAAPEFDLDNAASRHALVVLDRVPMVGVHPGGAGFLSRISRAGKGWRPSRIRTGGPQFHETAPQPRLSHRGYDRANIRLSQSTTISHHSAAAKGALRCVSDRLR